MEMRDPSNPGMTEPGQEQTLNQPADNAVVAAVYADNTVDTETVDPEAVAEEVVTEAIEQEAEDTEVATSVTKESLIAQARDMTRVDPAEIQREALTRLRQRFATLHKIEIEEARTQWAEQGNAPEDFAVAEDPDEVTFNELVATIRERKNQWAAAQELERQENLRAKNEIIDQIIALAEDTDNVNRTFPLYRELQDKFNAIGQVPPTDETVVWKRYQEARERYTDNLKINKELRDYDFKKNLEAKNALIAEAERLDAEPDVVVAFRCLQDLHDQWRTIGPVAKELREEIWTKFKEASAVINKKYQAFFEERKAREQQNEAAKNELCERIEDLDFTVLKSFADWEQMTARIIELQNQWKTLGFASRKVNNALFSRFRKRCDEFFQAKAAYFKTVKDEYAQNLARKMALVERAEALKDSTDWRKTADEFIEMQKEWRTIGAVPKRHSDAVWKRFLAACDYFFDRKKQATSGQRATEQANLKAKREIIDTLTQMASDEDGDDMADKLHDLQDKWQQIGHVPFKDKDKVNDAYRAAVNTLRRRLNIAENRVRMDRFESNISQIEGDQSKLFHERDRLVRALEARRTELRTYENNLGFLTSKSKSGESMVNEFRRKIDRIKEEIQQIKDKIGLIDTKLKK